MSDSIAGIHETTMSTQRRDRTDNSLFALLISPAADREQTYGTSEPQNKSNLRNVVESELVNVLGGSDDTGDQGI